MGSIMVLLLVIMTRLTSQAFAAALPTQYAGLGNVTWRGNITENGPIIELTGTSLHDIESQIAVSVPGFTWSTTWAARSLNGTYDTGMMKVPGTPICGVVDGHAACRPDAVYAGYNYLINTPGLCHVGGRQCTRVSCSYNAGIYYCNDKRGDMWVMCSDLGYYALYINHECYDFHDTWWHHGTAGQLFDSAGWNVFVGMPTAGEDLC